MTDDNLIKCLLFVYFFLMSALQGFFVLFLDVLKTIILQIIVSQLGIVYLHACV